MSYCYSFDEERFHGDFETEAEAIVEAFTSYSDTRVRLRWPGVRRHRLLHPASVGSDIFTSLSERLGEEVGEVAECFTMTAEQEQSSGDGAGFHRQERRLWLLWRQERARGHSRRVRGRRQRHRDHRHVLWPGRRCMKVIGTTEVSAGF